MSVVKFHLHRETLISALFDIISPGVPLYLDLDNCTDRHALDAIFRQQQLVSASAVSTFEGSEKQRTLAIQYINSMRSGSAPSALDCHNFWTELLHLHTRTVRFAATMLYAGAIDEHFVILKDPSLIGEEPSRIMQSMKGLWKNMLRPLWCDVNPYQRRWYARKLAKWCVECPHVFWTRRTGGELFAAGFKDVQDSVRNEFLRQARTMANHLNQHEGSLDPSTVAAHWVPVLKVHAESQGGQLSHSVNRRIALELLACFKGSDEYPSQEWREQVFQFCVTTNESAATIEAAIRLLWPETGLVRLLLKVPAKSGYDLGDVLAQTRPIHAWDEITAAIRCSEFQNSSELKLLVRCLVGLAKSVPDEKVLDFITTYLLRLSANDNANILRLIPKMLIDGVEPVGSEYFRVVDSLVQLNVEEVSYVFERWGTPALNAGGLDLLEKPRKTQTVGIKMSGWVNAKTKYVYAARAREVMKGGDPADLRVMFMTLVGDLATHEMPLVEFGVILDLIVRVFATLKYKLGCSNTLRIDAEPIYSRLTTAAGSSDADEVQIRHCVYKVRFLEIMDVFVSRDHPYIRALFPHVIFVDPCIPDTTMHPGGARTRTPPGSRHGTTEATTTEATPPA